MFGTPSIIVDEDKVRKNIKKMAEIAKKRGVRLRPHVKTHKIPKIAKMQIEAGAVGITVAKTTEAEVMASAGINDIFVAYPIVTDAKIDRVLELSKKIRLIVGVDSIEGARKLSDKAKMNNQHIEVRLEVDTGLRRTGVKYEKAVDLAKEISILDNVNLTGIYTYKGALFKGRPTLDLYKAGLEEGELMAALAKRLRKDGLEIKDVSGGSTPTAENVAQVEGITEIRPGTYVFNDRMQMGYKVCRFEDCAAKVVATVVSIPSEDLLVIDGGSKTFATDVQPNSEPLKLDGFGECANHHEGVLERLTEEHGMVRVPPGQSFQVGDTIEIIPNHICSTINLHDAVYFKKEDGSLEKLAVSARGKLY